MSVSLGTDGLLPPGVHDLSLSDVEQLFGRFQSSDRRIKLFHALVELVELWRAKEFVRHVIVDGSFITSKPDPSDIDLLLAVDPTMFDDGDLPPTDYNSVSSRWIRKKFKFDVMVAPEGSAAYNDYLEFFAGLKGDATKTKGLVRVAL